MPKRAEPIGTKRDRFVVILIGVALGYFAGRVVEDRYAWENARILTMVVGGLLAGVVGRFTLERFRGPADSGPTRRSP